MLLIQHAPDTYYLTMTCIRLSTRMVCCCDTVLDVTVSEVGPNETPQLRDGYCKRNGDQRGMTFRFLYQEHLVLLEDADIQLGVLDGLLSVRK